MNKNKFDIYKMSDQILFKNKTCFYVTNSGLLPKGILVGSGMIIPIMHRQTVFDLTREEIVDTFDLLMTVKHYIDKKYDPAGYNIGWNNGQVAGQNVFHAHMHVIPRYKGEKLEGKGIRYFLKNSN